MEVDAMAEETFRKVKDPDDLNHTLEAADAEALREGQAWNKVSQRNGLNADMVVRTEHSDTEYVWVIDRTRVP